MKKKHWAMIGACVVLLGGLITLYAFHSAESTRKANAEAIDKAAKDKAAEVASEVAAAREAAQFSTQEDWIQLDIERDGQTLVLLRGEDGNWHAKNDETPLLQALVSDIANSTRSRYAAETLGAETANPSDYGLLPPTVRFVATAQDGTLSALRIGAMTPDQNFYYAIREGDDTVLLLPKNDGDRLNVAFEQLIDTTLPLVTGGNLMSLSLQVRGQDLITAERAALPTQSADSIEGILATIQMTSPVQNRDIYLITLVPAVLEPLAYVSLGAIVDKATPEALEAYGFLNPSLEILLESTVGRYHLTVGNTSETNGDISYAIYEGLPYIFEVSTQALRPLYDVTALDLMSRFVSLISIDEITGVNIEAPGHKYQTTWLPESMINGRSVQESAYRVFHEALVGISLDAVLQTYVPEGNPAVTITFHRIDGLDPLVDLYYEYDENFYAIKKEGTGVLLIDKQQIQTMLNAAEDLLMGYLPAS